MIPIKDIQESNIDSCISGVVVCTAHPEETIEIYCNDHSKPCCTSTPPHIQYTMKLLY
jgi:hypothetical protein